MKTILVIGGTGYIGSETINQLNSTNKYKVVSVSRKNFQREECFCGDVKKEDEIEDVFKKYSFDVVLLLYGLQSIARSENIPEYFDNEVVGVENILKLCSKYSCKKVVYLSSSAIYPSGFSINEQTPFSVNSFYAFTKTTVEKLLDWYKKYAEINYVILRCSTVSGKSNVGKSSKCILSIALGKKQLTIFGKDFDTPDKTLIRDYVYVGDVAAAIVKAIEYPYSDTFNVGSGVGYSVLEVVDHIEKIIKQKIKIDYIKRRLIDEDYQVLNIEKAKTKLGWSPKFSMDEIIETFNN